MQAQKKPRVTFRNASGISSPLGRNKTPTPTPSPPPTDPNGTPAPESWANLRSLMDTLKETADISKLAPVRSVVEGLVELIGLYEDAAQGQKEFDDMRLQLECTFDELSHHLSSSPVMTITMDSICWSLRKEIEAVKARQALPRKRKPSQGDGDACVVLECYRRIQDHLQRLTRNANMSTWQIVDQMATNHRLDKLAGSLWECYDSAKAAALQRGPCTKGTRRNVLAQMHRWAGGRNTGNIYWMSGMAGTGKTTIAYSLCEQLHAEKDRLLCASFFCSRSLPECRDVGRIVPSIAFQLAQVSRPFRYALSQATEKDPIAHTRLPRMQFDSLILQPFSSVEVRDAFPTNMVVVIDALDECDDTKSTKQILDVLLTKSKDLPIKFVVSSRPEPAIRDRMKKNGGLGSARVVLHELDSGEVQADIRTYLEAELEPIAPSEVEIKQLVARTGVLFIYAATVVRYVGYDDFGRNPRGRLRAVLAKTGQHVKAQTKDIDELYSVILDAAFKDPSASDEEQGDMKLVLDTVICAREPLTVTTLSQLLQLDDIDRVLAAIRPLWSVLHVMGRNMTVTTLHASFPDHMLDSQRSGAWYCNAATHHQLLAQRCFDCIRVAKPQFNICQLESSYLFDKEVADLDERVQQFIPSELRYSCQYWSSHLDAAESDRASELLPLLSHFLIMHLLLWLEVRNLIKSFPKTIAELMIAKRWATQHGMARDMVNLLSDAWRFASTFVSSPVSQSTPHLYASMIPLLPPSSPIRKHYSGRFRGLIDVEGSAIDLRKDALLAHWKFDLTVKCMACSPDGTRVAIVGRARTPFFSSQRLYLLDAFSGIILLNLSLGGQTQVDFITFSPDSTRLASGREDGTVSVWDATTGQPLLTPFLAHTNRISSILYSHDGCYIISASQDEPIRVWDALSGNLILTPLLGHAYTVTCIAITSDDARVVFGSSDSAIRVWGMQSGKIISSPIILPDDRVTAIALSPDDLYIVAGSPKGIRVWDGQTGLIALDLFPNLPIEIRSLSISPDGATIVSTSNIDGVQIWDATSGKVVAQLGPFSDDFSSDNWATYSPDGTRIIFARGNGTIRLLDTQTAATPPNPLPGHTSYITSVDISPDGRRIVSGSSDGTLCFWDMAQGTLLVGPLPRHTREINMVRFSPDGSRIVSCASDSTICQLDAQSGAVHGMPIALASSRSFVVASAAYSQDGALIVSLTKYGELSVWDSSSGYPVLGPIANSDVLLNGIYAVFSPDDVNLIAGYDDGSISVWDSQTGQLVYSHEGHGGSVSCLALSPDGLYYAQSFSSGIIGLNIIHTEQMPGVFHGHTLSINSVRFSSDGTRLVSGSRDKTVRVWDVATRQSLFGPLNGHTKAITSVAFSPDGKFVVSASEDLAIRVWNVEPKAPSSQGRRRDAEFADWVLNEDGWVVSGKNRRLFWVPSDLHTSLMQPRNTILISREGYVRLKFDDALIGGAWAGCFCGH